MAGELEAVVKAMFEGLDGKDYEAIMRDAAEDIQGVDEISRRWMRGRDALGEYIGGLLTMVEDVRSELHDVREVLLADTGIVTFWLEQDYTLEGSRQHVSAPSTVVLRRDRDGWKVVLFHSIPLPEEATG
ncbi:MAG TPA: nuclear transport factor 2 family protein [Gaiellaceae bacterium]|nr:nuclear transport factor 2 family protein [Gaiellaceae bacterium]